MEVVAVVMVEGVGEVVGMVRIISRGAVGFDG